MSFTVDDVITAFGQRGVVLTYDEAAEIKAVGIVKWEHYVALPEFCRADLMEWNEPIPWQCIFISNKPLTEDDQRRGIELARHLGLEITIED